MFRPTFKELKSVKVKKNHTDPISLTLRSKDLNGVFTSPIALARSSPHVGVFSAVVVDQTPVGALVNGPGVIPQPDMFNL